MQVKLTADMRAVPEGEVYPRQYREGDVVTGNVAAAAIAQKKGEEFKPAGVKKQVKETDEDPGKEPDKDDGGTKSPAPLNKAGGPAKNK